MTKHVNEYDPNATGGIKSTNMVQTDSMKLKFNNIQSCIAVGFVPSTGTMMTGVHFTTLSTGDDAELAAAMNTIKNLNTGVQLDAYLVASYSAHHSRTNLVKKLKKICRSIYLCDIPPNAAGGANLDVKMERTGNGVRIYIREHAVFLTDADGRNKVKPKYAGAAVNQMEMLKSGKTIYQKDRDQKPWTPAPFTKIT